MSGRRRIAIHGVALPVLATSGYVRGAADYRDQNLGGDADLAGVAGLSWALAVTVVGVVLAATIETLVRLQQRRNDQ